MIWNPDGRVPCELVRIKLNEGRAAMEARVILIEWSTASMLRMLDRVDPLVVAGEHTRQPLNDLPTILGAVAYRELLHVRGCRVSH